jgi:hypothetical protein
MSTTAERMAELTKLPKQELARIHAVNGGLMGIKIYLKWTKDELINAVLRDESENGGL